METQTRNLLLGGAIVLGGALCGWYIYGKSQHEKECKPITKELMIQLLKEQERESYPVYKCLCSIFMEVLKQYQETNSNVDMIFEDLKESVLMQYPTIEEKYNAISKNTLKKYGVNEKEYWNAVEVIFKNDQDVQKLMHKNWTGFENACRGNPPDLACTIPDFLTPEKTLQVRAKLLKQQAKNIRKIFEPIDEEGRSFWDDKERVFSFIASARVELAINDEEREVLVDEGLDVFEEAPQKIFDAAIFKYINKDAEFKHKFLYLERERVSFLEELGNRKLQSASIKN